jgi:uncharacterized protein (TIGR00730 family)
MTFDPEYPDPIDVPSGELSQHPEARGEDEKERPLPADEAPDSIPSQDLFDSMRRTVQRLEDDDTSRGDLKILDRTLRELRYAFKVFQPYRCRRKVTIFGSARTQPDEPAYQTAVQLGERMIDHGWMVITGAGGGIMEAGHRGAGTKMSMGLNIMLPFEQSANEVIEGDHKLVTLKYFFTRKLMFLKECSAVACLPGGFGTLDETLEVLTLMQTGKQAMLPLVMLDEPGGDYWLRMTKFFDEVLLRDGLISSDDSNLYRVTDSVDDAIEEILNFYSVYHSMRYVKDRLVLRINEKLTDAHLDRLNSQFSDILVSGSIKQVDALPQEANEPEISHLPRLQLHFNRRALGRFRQLINEINRPQVD